MKTLEETLQHKHLNSIEECDARIEELNDVYGSEEDACLSWRDMFITADLLSDAWKRKCEIQGLEPYEA